MPYRAKAIYEASPGAVYKVENIPMVTIFGLIGAIVGGVMVLAFMFSSPLWPDQRLSLSGGVRRARGCVDHLYSPGQDGSALAWHQRRLCLQGDPARVGTWTGSVGIQYCCDFWHIFLVPASSRSDFCTHPPTERLRCRPDRVHKLIYVVADDTALLFPKRGELIEIVGDMLQIRRERVIEAPILAHDVDDIVGVDQFGPGRRCESGCSSMSTIVSLKSLRLISTICIFSSRRSVVHMVGLSRSRRPLSGMR